MTNSANTSAALEVTPELNEFVIFCGERAIVSLKDRAVVGGRGNPTVEKTEAVRVAAIKFIKGLIDNVPTEHVFIALREELPVLDPNTAMRVMNSLVSEGAKAAYGRYRFEQQLEQEKARMGIDDERGEQMRNSAFGEYAGTNEVRIPAAVLIDCTELLHAHLHGLFASAERERFGRPTMFNTHLYRGLMVGYVVNPESGAFSGCETIAEYIAQRDRMQDMQREMEIRATQERGNAVDFTKYKAS